MMIQYESEGFQRLEKLPGIAYEVIHEGFRSKYPEELKKVIDSRTEGLIPKTKGSLSDPRLIKSGYLDYWNYWETEFESQNKDSLSVKLRNTQPYFKIQSDLRRGGEEAKPQYYRAGNEAHYLYNGSSNISKPRKDVKIPAKSLMYYLHGESHFASSVNPRKPNQLFRTVVDKSVKDGVTNSFSGIRSTFSEDMEDKYGRL